MDKKTNTQNIQTQIAANQKDAVMLFFSGVIHMPAISEMILKNSKQAVANLIIAMASASKGGMSNEQITETLKSPALNHAAIIPIMKAMIPTIGLCVAWKIAGKVITESVTYGT